MRAVQPIERAPSSSRSTMPNGSPCSSDVPDHPLVALLEDVERHLLAREQDKRQLEDRKLETRHPGRSAEDRPGAPGWPSIDFEAEGLLDGLTGKAREARLALLEELADDGRLARGAEAGGRGGPAGAAARSSGSSRRTRALHARQEIAEEPGLEPEFLVRLLQALGAPIPDGGRARLRRG